MDVKEMIGLLQQFFDGHIMSAAEVTYYTGEQPEAAEKIYQAIQALRGMKATAP